MSKQANRVSMVVEVSFVRSVIVESDSDDGLYEICEQAAQKITAQLKDELQDANPNTFVINRDRKGVAPIVRPVKIEEIGEAKRNNMFDCTA